MIQLNCACLDVLLARIILFLVFFLYPLHIDLINLQLNLVVEQLALSRLLALQQTDGRGFTLVEVARVGYVFSVAPVHFILVNVIRVCVALLSLPVQHFTRDHGPSEQIAALVQRSEEAVLLTPDQVFGLVAHSNAVK